MKKSSICLVFFLFLVTSFFAQNYQEGYSDFEWGTSSEIVGKKYMLEEMPLQAAQVLLGDIIPLTSSSKVYASSSEIEEMRLRLFYFTDNKLFAGITVYLAASDSFLYVLESRLEKTFGNYDEVIENEETGAPIYFWEMSPTFSLLYTYGENKNVQNAYLLFFNPDQVEKNYNDLLIEQENNIKF